MVRVTFSLDDATIARIRQTAERLGKPQSQVVREAVAEYAERADRLSDEERRHALSVLGRRASRWLGSQAAGVDRELRAIRAARKAGGRREHRA